MVVFSSLNSSDFTTKAILPELGMVGLYGIRKRAFNRNCKFFGSGDRGRCRFGFGRLKCGNPERNIRHDLHDVRSHDDDARNGKTDKKADDCSQNCVFIHIEFRQVLTRKK